MVQENTAVENVSEKHSGKGQDINAIRKRIYFSEPTKRGTYCPFCKHSVVLSSRGDDWWVCYCPCDCETWGQGETSDAAYADARSILDVI